VFRFGSSAARGDAPPLLLMMHIDQHRSYMMRDDLENRAAPPAFYW
jgi:hypothetical protein